MAQLHLSCRAFSFGALVCAFACSSDSNNNNNNNGSGGASGALQAGGAGGAAVTGGSGGAPPAMGGAAGMGGAGAAPAGGMGGMAMASGGMPMGGAGGDMAAGGMPPMGMGGMASGGMGGAGGDSGEGVESLPPMSGPDVLPIVFVHGFAGSAQQFESQSMRFDMNGYPAELIYDYDHDGAGFDLAGYADGADAVVDRALSETGATQVYLVGHSRGTAVSSAYLGNPTRAAKVAKYVSLDGGGCAAISVPCIDPNQMQTTNVGQAHVEVATSKESFVKMYEFFLGQTPQRVEIAKQPGMVEISGRAIDFPANTGRNGTTLELYEIDHATGYRVDETPEATFMIGADGAWGPTQVSPDSYYEFALSTPGAGVQHFYFQRFLRDNKLVRLLSGDPNTSATRMNTNSGPGHSAIVVLRMREWYASGENQDTLEVTLSSSGMTEMVGNVLIPAASRGNIAMHIHDDAATPANTTLEPLPYFSTSAAVFQYGTDVYMPATDPPSGTITLTNIPRGDTARPQVINVPNWVSDGHIITVMFADFPVD